MVSDGEHSCTDKRNRKQQNNRLHALQCPWMGGMMGGREEGLLHLPSDITMLLSSEVIYSLKRKQNQKKEFSRDILWFVLVSETKITSLSLAFGQTHLPSSWMSSSGKGSFPAASEGCCTRHSTKRYPVESKFHVKRNNPHDLVLSSEKNPASFIWTLWLLFLLSCKSLNSTAVPACGWDPAVKLIMDRTCALWFRLRIKKAAFFFPQSSFKS